MYHWHADEMMATIEFIWSESEWSEVTITPKTRYNDTQGSKAPTKLFEEMDFVIRLPMDNILSTMEAANAWLG